MELSIIRRETTGAVPNQYNESETITKFEIMDGAPVRGGGVFFEHTTAFPSPNSSRFRILTGIFLYRRDDPYPTLPWRVRSHADLPRCQQEI